MAYSIYDLRSSSTFCFKLLFFKFPQIIKDRFLILGVAMLVAVDLTILVTYTLVEGIRGNLVAQEVVHKEKPVNIEEVSIYT